MTRIYCTVKGFMVSGQTLSRKYEKTFEEEAKHLPTETQTKVVVVAFATYYLSTLVDSPVAFQGESHLGITDLRMSKDEGKILFQCRCLYPNWEQYFVRLLLFTNGSFAAFTIALNQVSHAANIADRRSTDGELTEEIAISELLFQTPFAALQRCFPVKRMDDVAKNEILSELVHAYKADMGGISEEDNDAGEDKESVRKLVKAGILDASHRFTSIVAKTFYYHMVFPRAASDEEVPLRLDDLITEAAKKLSARRLRLARQVNEDGLLRSPKEAVWQQLFHEAIASLLPVKYRIVPEIGTKAEINGKFVTGELDFYIKNGSKWALELLRDGKGIVEHLGRILASTRMSRRILGWWLTFD